MDCETSTGLDQTPEGLSLLNEYFEASTDEIEEVWHQCDEDFDKTFDKLLEIGYNSKISTSGDIVSEMPELRELLNEFADLNRNQVINAYLDCDNDLEKARQTIQKSLDISLNPLFPPLPKPNVEIPTPPDPILQSLKDKDEDKIMDLCEMFPSIRKEDIREVFIHSCNRNFEDCMNLLLAVSEGDVSINEILPQKKNKGKFKKKNKNKNGNNNFIPQPVNDSTQPSPSSVYMKDSGFPLVQRLRFDKLCEEFPQIDPSIIADIFYENGMDGTQTENIIRNEYLEYILIPKPKPQPKDPPKLVEVNINGNGEYEEGCEEYGLESIKREMSELQMRIDNRIKHAQQYYREKKREAGNYEMERVREDRRRFKELLNEKCEIVYNEKNSAMNTCDLHLQTQETAIKYIEDAIARCKSHGVKELKIITGRGNHSKNRKAILLPTVNKYLRDKGYDYSKGGGDFTVKIK